MTHPLERWLGPGLGTFFRISLGFALVVGAALGALDAGLRGPNAPLGIVSFEIAGDGAQALLDGWSEAQRRDAILVQGLDYLFLVVYASALASGALLCARRLSGRLAAFAGPAAWAALAAGAFDVVENTPMTLALRSGTASALGAQISLVCATLKALGLVVVCGYLLVALGALAVGRARR